MSLEETLSKNTYLFLFLTHFADEDRVEARTDALRRNREVKGIQIQVTEVRSNFQKEGVLLYTGYLAAFVRILEALQGRESLEGLTFRNIDLAPPEHAAAVSRLLRSTPSLKALTFYECHLPLDGARVIREGLRESPSSLESLSVTHCLSPGMTIERFVDNTMNFEFERHQKRLLDNIENTTDHDWNNWNRTLGLVLTGIASGVDRNEIANVLVEATSHGGPNCLKELHLEHNQLADDAMAIIIRHLADRQAPLEKMLLRGNNVGPNTGQAIACLLAKTTTLVELHILTKRRLEDNSSGARTAIRTIVSEGLRYNFELQELSIGTSYCLTRGDLHRYLQRNTAWREIVQNDNRDEWVELLIQNQENHSALYYYLRKCPVWIYGSADSDYFFL